MAIMQSRFKFFFLEGGGGGPEDSAKLSEIASHFQLLSIDFNKINFGKLLFLVPKRGRVQKSESNFKRS